LLPLRAGVCRDEERRQHDVVVDEQHHVAARGGDAHVARQSAIRLRALGLRRRFAWDAYLWHVKPPATETLDAALEKTIAKARMAARFVHKNPSARAKLATGAYALNRLRAHVFAPRAVQPLLAGLATSAGVPAPLARVARELVLDSVYVDELERALR